jgi:hypothetical protein
VFCRTKAAPQGGQDRYETNSSAPETTLE